MSSKLQDEIALHLIATGIVQIAQRVERGEPALSYPYPAPLQRGLNYLVALNLMRHRPIPQSVPDLLRWCAEKPLVEWGLQLEEQSIGERDVLLYDNMPTSLCDEWSRNVGDVEADVTETRFMDDVFRICQSRTSGDSLYVKLRHTLATCRVLTTFEHVSLKLDSELSVVSALLDEAYLEAPLSCRFGDEYLVCGGCGNLLQPDRKDRPVCENERCRAQGSPVGKIIAARESPKWLIRPLRRFIANPAVTELRLAEVLRDMGLQVELWPQFDAYDIRITFPDQHVWAIDVKDWSSPELLARSVKSIPTYPPWSRAFYVFPDERRREREDYKRAFTSRCNQLSKEVAAIYEGELISHAHQELKRRA